MNARAPASEGAAGAAPLHWGLWVGLAALLAAAALFLTANDASLLLLMGLAIALVGGVALLWNTQAGLTFAAFAIVPLGIIQAPIGPVTVNLPEVLLLALFAKETVRFIRNDEKPAPEALWGAVGLYVLASSAAVITGLALGNPFTAVLQDFRQFTEFIAAFLLVVHRVRTRSQFRRILAAYVAGASIVAVHGILQRFTGLGIPGNQLLSDMVHYESVRSGSFYGSTPLGALMVLGLGPALGLLLTSRSVPARAVLLAAVGLLVTSAVFTQTRASWGAIALLVLIIFLFVRKTPLLIAAAVVGVLVVGALLGPQIVRRMGDIEISRQEKSLLSRVQYYTTAWHIFRYRPVTGLGWGCYYNMNDILANQRYVPRQPAQRLAGQRPPESTVHSAYLQLLVKSGALGLVGFLFVLWRWGRTMLRALLRRPHRERDHALFLGLFAALAGYLAHSSLENFFQWPVMAQSFWLLLGLSMVMASQLVQQGRFRTGAPQDDTT